MNIDIYCDESKLNELLEGNKNGYVLIGGLWLIREEEVKERHKNLKTKI